MNKPVALPDAAVGNKSREVVKTANEGLEFLREIFSLLISLLQASKENTTFKF
jgi:hypothetical protein